MSVDKLPTEFRKVKYEYSPIEIHEYSMQLANKTKEFASITEEKKTIVSQYGARLNEIKATQNKLSNQIADGYELRDVEFTITYHKPENGKKTLTPINGGEVVVEKMAQWDFTLFNQASDVDKDEKKTLEDRQTVEAGSDKNPFPWSGEAPLETYSTDADKKTPKIEKKKKAKSPFKSDEPVGDLLQKERDKLKGN